MAISSVAQNSFVAASSDGTRAVAQTTPLASEAKASVPAATVASVSAQAPSPDRVAQAVKQVNEAFSQKGQNLYASIESDAATGISVVKVQDRTTKEVISQYPSKAIVAMAEAFDQSQAAKGRLINISA